MRSYVGRRTVSDDQYDSFAVRSKWFGKPNFERMKLVRETIHQKPGITPYLLSKELDLSIGQVRSTLDALENRGILLSENQYGGLSLFE